MARHRTLDSRCSSHIETVESKVMQLARYVAFANITDLPQTRGKASLDLLRTRYVNWNTYVMENGVPAVADARRKKSHLLRRANTLKKGQVRKRVRNILYSSEYIQLNLRPRYL